MALLSAPYPLVLASSSAMREKMLAQAGLTVTTLRPKCDEEALKCELAGLPPPRRAVALAKAKAASIGAIHGGWAVIGADQICELEGEALSKPGAPEQAARQLRRLSGKTHFQHSAACFYREGACLWEGVETAELAMRELSDAEIAAYIALDHPIHACGAYYYEARGKHLFASVRGSEGAVLGLPIQSLLAALHGLGFLRLGETG